KISNTLAKTVPLVLTAFATAISFESGIFNIGGEGQLCLGAFAAAYIGFTFTQLPKGIGIILAILVSAIIGGLFALIPAILKVRYKIDEVITTIMLNSVAMLRSEERRVGKECRSRRVRDEWKENRIEEKTEREESE